MNREILFRGKRTDNGKWVEGYYIHTRRHECIVTACIDDGYVVYGHYATDVEMYVVDPNTIGQYTGLKDKNGKRIFEGDICRNTRTGETISVKWHGTMAGYVWNRKKDYLSAFGELFRVYDKYEVIGNIHDNPELIGVAE